MRYAQAARDIAREAGALLREHLAETRQVERKSSRIDLVSEMDKRAEALVAERLRERFPDHGIRCEEGTRQHTDARYCWHVDPLDGTNNYVHQFPWFAVSIALEDRERQWPVAGAVYNVMLDEMYWAEEGQGAYLNGERISVSRSAHLHESILATGFPYWIAEARHFILENLESFLTQCQGVRRAGVASLDLAQVACGRFDGYWEESLSSWDVAAGALLVREAGGVVTDYEGSHVGIPAQHIVASNGLIHDAMVERVRGRHREVPRDRS